MTTCYKYINETNIEREPETLKLDNGGRVFGFRSHDDATKLSYGYKPLIAEAQPAPRQGYHYDPRYTDGVSTITQSWLEVADPVVPPAPRVLSKLKVKRYLDALTRTVDGVTITAWNEFKTALTALDAYDEFALASNLREDDSGFAAYAPQLSYLLAAYGTTYDALAEACIYVPDNEVI